MSKNKDLSQIGGDESSNYQAVNQYITHNNYGISDSEVKSISLELWQKNATKLEEQAAATAFDRIEYFVERFVRDNIDKNNNLLYSLNDPGMQMTLLLAQQTFVKSGEKEIADLLLDFLNN